MGFTKTVHQDYHNSILDAIAAMPFGGTLIIESGEYEISDTIMVPSNIRIRGNGEVLIRSTIDAPILQGKPCTDVFIENLYLVPVSGMTDTLVYFSNASNITLNNVNISAESIPVTGNGFFCDNSTNIRINKCTVKKFVTNIYLKSCFNSQITDTISAFAVGTQWGHDGILLEKCEQFGVLNNELYENGEHGLYLSGCTKTRVSGNKITHNLGNGIRIGAYPETQYSNHLFIRDNICNNNVNGINISDGCHKMLITENSCNDNLNYGIISDGTVKPHHNVYSNNFMSGNASTAQYKITDVSSIVRDNIID